MVGHGLFGDTDEKSVGTDVFLMDFFVISSLNLNVLLTNCPASVGNFTGADI